MDSWANIDDKIIRILDVLDKELDENIPIAREDIVMDVLRVFSETDPVPLPIKKETSGLFPLEHPQEYRPDIPSSVLNPESNAIIDLMASKKYSVLGIDSSYFTSGPHILVDIVVVNTGYWYYNYGFSSGGSGNRAKVFSEISDGTRLSILVKNFEISVLEEITDKLDGDKKFLFLDESMNLLYTLSWSTNERNAMVDLLAKTISLAENGGVIPLGIFYTRSRDIVKALRVIHGKDLPDIKDRVIMNRMLDTYSRSPIFRLYSAAIDDHGLDILAFYIKLGDNNVFRVEFPSKYQRYIDDIFLVVLAQSILGYGYPYVLQKAHDIAVITQTERELILDEICRKLGIPTSQVLYSRKQFRKRWPIQ